MTTLEHTFTDLKRICSTLDDLQATRIRATNRQGDAERRGFSVVNDAEISGGLAAIEHQAELMLCRMFRKNVPAEIVSWQKETQGIGEKSLAKLLGYIGHPAIATPHHWEGAGSDRVLVQDPMFVRTLPQLRSYCGYGDAEAQKRKKGMTADDLFACGNIKAKTQLFLMAESCVKNLNSPFRVVYDDARVEYSTREGWAPIRQHKAAMRKISKEILHDLWEVSIKSAANDGLIEQ